MMLNGYSFDGGELLRAARGYVAVMHVESYCLGFDALVLLKEVDGVQVFFARFGVLQITIRAIETEFPIRREGDGAFGFGAEGENRGGCRIAKFEFH